jgi:hypothetical protein
LQAWRRHSACLRLRLQGLSETVWKAQVAKLAALFIKFKLHKHITPLYSI